MFVPLPAGPQGSALLSFCWSGKAAALTTSPSAAGSCSPGVQSTARAGDAPAQNREPARQRRARSQAVPLGFPSMEHKTHRCTCSAALRYFSAAYDQCHTSTKGISLLDCGVGPRAVSWESLAALLTSAASISGSTLGTTPPGRSLLAAVEGGGNVDRVQGLFLMLRILLQSVFQPSPGVLAVYSDTRLTETLPRLPALDLPAPSFHSSSLNEFWKTFFGYESTKPQRNYYATVSGLRIRFSAQNRCRVYETSSLEVGGSWKTRLPSSLVLAEMSRLDSTYDAPRRTPRKITVRMAVSHRTDHPENIVPRIRTARTSAGACQTSTRSTDLSTQAFIRCSPPWYLSLSSEEALWILSLPERGFCGIFFTH